MTRGPALLLCLAAALGLGSCGLFLCVGVLAPQQAEEREAPERPDPAEREPAAAARDTDPGPVGKPTPGSPFGTCADGTPASCMGRGCCSHHGGTGSGKRSHHKKR